MHVHVVAVSFVLQQDTMYMLGTYNFKCFEYLLCIFAIGLKESCLDFVEKQLKELAEKVCINDDVATCYCLQLCHVETK